MTQHEVFEALRTGSLVHRGVISGRVDELYRSVWGKGLRVRLCDEHGRVWHFAPEEIELVQKPIEVEAGATADGGIYITARGDLLKEVWTSEEGAAPHTLPPIAETATPLEHPNQLGAA